ncbi:MAG TPA: DNA primase [Candidatus Aphodoplasma excrementigallinarum]|uniref:DNA primase n=1 Tax=Candidatus Aphodoplasma excrementigallinarum TaxID=2840673 RepID=A0A9D1NHS6_9FIRM|nr:DNA primase [Candidatus Aphodoplasma excrementigallinarum]
MLYSEELISEVIGANDIVDVIGMYTALKKSGRGFVGLCPFHSEKTPSFHVSPDKQLYHCFGCGEGGTVLTFVMKAENLDFVEGLKFLADRARIALPEPEANENADRLFKKKQRLISANTYAAKFFYHCLAASPEGAQARAYLKERAIAPKTAASFGLGFAPPGRNALINHLKPMGYSESELVDFGLATVRDNQFVDKFRNRVMFPIIDVRGNVIGFGGRVMDDSKPKYLNSPETAAFNKRLNLFALNFAKNKKSDTLILVEGYMDVISLHQVGINNAVATLGTALTEEQARLIARYARDVVLCYDTDEAGVKATMRAIEIFSKTDVRVKVLSLPGAKDPDEYIKSHGGGSEAFLQAVKGAVPATLFRINALKRQYDIDNSIDDKIRFITEAAQVLLSTNNMVEVDTYADLLAKNYDIKKESIYAEIRKLQGKRERQEKSRIVHRTANAGVTRSASPTEERRPAPVRGDVATPLEKAERSLLSLIFTSRSAAKYAEGELGAEYYSNAVHQKLAQLCYAAWDSGTAPDASQILLSFDETQAGYVTQVLMDRAVYEDDIQAAKDLLLTIRQESITKKISEETDPAVIQKLLELQAQLKEKRGGSPA